MLTTARLVIINRIGFRSVTKLIIREINWILKKTWISFTTGNYPTLIVIERVEITKRSFNQSNELNKTRWFER